MKTIFRKIQSHDQLSHQLNFPESFFERLWGIRRYSWASAYFSMVFKSPCILHSFGLKHELTLRIFAPETNVALEQVRFPISSIAICKTPRAWVLESISQSSWDSNSNQIDKSKLSKKSSQIKIIDCTKIIRVIRWFYFITFLMFITSVAFAASNQPTVKMQVGESKEVSLNEAPRSLDLSQPDIIDVQRIGNSNKILITGLKSGLSTLAARFHGGQTRTWIFQVGQPLNLPSGMASLSSASLLRTARDVQRKTGLEVTVDNGRLALFGLIQNETQVKAILETCLDRDECLPRFQLSESAWAILASKLQSHFEKLDGADIIVLVHLGGIILKGSANHEELAQKILKLAQSVSPRVSQQLIVVPSSSTMVESQLYFFKISQTGLTALGISTAFDNKPDAGTLLQVKTPPQSAQIRKGPTLGFAVPDLLLKAISQKGVIKQIAQPSMLIASGGRGELLSGGELLFQSQGQVQKFYSQNYGISVVLSPRVINNDKIVQKIELKITHPQADPTQHAISSMSSSQLNTEISSRPGEHLLLTRINQKANGKSVSKIPIVGHLPIIGELFKSRDLSEENAELWITIKSSIASSQVLPALEPITLDKGSPQAHWLD